ncbi:MAG: T9SS type A sorting domain-containing protein [Bacteroidales bacterium]
MKKIFIFLAFALLSLPMTYAQNFYMVTNDGETVSTCDTGFIFNEIHVTGFNDQTCLGSNEGYEITFSVSDWNGSPTSDYYVNGDSASLVNFYDTIQSPGNYNYTVTDDNACSEIVLEGYRDCDCASPGTMSSIEMITLCEGECTGNTVSHNEDSIVMDTAVFEFIIHTGDDYPLAYNDTPDFCLAGFGGSVDEVYYVSAVSGYDENSDGHTEPGDSCYSVSQGTPVKWLQPPVSDAGSEHDTCGLVIPLNGNDVPAGMTGFWTSDCNFAAVQGTNYHDPDMVAMAENYGDCTFTWNITNGPCTDEDTVVMHFNQDPGPNAGNDTAICGNEIELSVEHSLPGTTFQWAGNADFDPDTSASTTITVNNPGTYAFTLTEYNGSCYAQDEMIVTFLSTPEPVIQNPDDTVCGTTYNLDVQNVTGDGQWTAFENGTEVYPSLNITSPNTQVVIGGITGTFRTIEFVWTETNAYQEVECSDSVSCNITFGNSVYAYAGNDSEKCGIEGSLDADTIGFGPDISGSWWLPDVPGMFIPDANAPDPAYRLTSMTSFGDSAHVSVPFVWEVTNGACSDLDTAYITFHQAPEAYAGPDDVSCGMNYQLLAYYTLHPTTTYTPSVHWSSLPDNPSIANFEDSSIPNTMVNVEEAGEYGFVWRENNSFLTSCNDRDTVWIEFKEKPVTNAGNDTIFCDLTGELQAEPYPPPSTGHWSFNSDDIFLADTTDPNTSIVSNVYTEGNPDFDHFPLIWIENIDGCTDADTIYVGFDSMPDPLDTVIQEPSDGILPEGETGTLIIENSVPGYIYWATKEGAPYSDPVTGTGNNLVLGNNFTEGDYECRIESIGGCSPGEPYLVTFTEETGANTHSASKLHIYPNPATNRLYIFANKQIESVEIMNLQGKSVFAKQDCVQEIDISGLTEGLYFVKIQTTENLYVKRFVKQ